eukprot:CAMPEP_0204125574 /NCGR_PEP_ID=MMETSP0361-20130328/10514_1 /ASSEMBLY_ACC=CAM_ASM_000343 /TAXON_ID=268821 /ORGANISM="Scrippsiella Hangoei, Strain SHTV-5" /LENGTH=115 /DNA_ID=CAMNT_0051077327 /DNA_START=13 /DNA_END=357 /DNA_ORIENTATION=+
MTQGHLASQGSSRTVTCVDLGRWPPTSARIALYSKGRSTSAWTSFASSGEADWRCLLEGASWAHRPALLLHQVPSVLASTALQLVDIFGRERDATSACRRVAFEGATRVAASRHQ